MNWYLFLESLTGKGNNMGKEKKTFSGTNTYMSRFSFTPPGVLEWRKHLGKLHNLDVNHPICLYLGVLLMYWPWIVLCDLQHYWAWHFSRIYHLLFQYLIQSHSNWSVTKIIFSQLWYLQLYWISTECFNTIKNEIIWNIFGLRQLLILILI